MPETTQPTGRSMTDGLQSKHDMIEEKLGLSTPETAGQHAGKAAADEVQADQAKIEEQKNRATGAEVQS